MDGLASDLNAKKVIFRPDASPDIDETIRDVCKNCADSSMIASANYMSTARYYAGEKFKVWTLGNIAFMYGIQNKNSFRLIAIAVKEDHQRQHIASALLKVLYEFCQKNELSRITLRTHMGGEP